MNPKTNILISTSPSTLPARKPRLTVRSLYRSTRRRYTGKERDSETGLHYYGARYLDSRTGRWLSGDPAVSDYVPSAPVDDEAKKRNGSLPGMGGVFNYANLHVYHYAGNNPVKYTDPDGRSPKYTLSIGLTPADSTIDLLAPCSGGASNALIYAGLGLAATSTIVSKNKKAKDLLDKIDNLLKPESIQITDEASDVNINESREHTSNARPSTKERHERGKSRQEADRDGRKGNSNPPRRRPEGHRGPWPPNGSSGLTDQQPERVQDLDTHVNYAENKSEQ